MSDVQSEVARLLEGKLASAFLEQGVVLTEEEQPKAARAVAEFLEGCVTPEGFTDILKRMKTERGVPLLTYWSGMTLRGLAMLLRGRE